MTDFTHLLGPGKQHPVVFELPLKLDLAGNVGVGADHSDAIAIRIMLYYPPAVENPLPGAVFAS